MQKNISVVEFIDNDGKLFDTPTRKIVENFRIKDLKEKPVRHGYIDIKKYDDDHYSYYYEKQPVHILESFIVITSGKFIYRDKRPLTMSGGFGEVNRLAYHWSATILSDNISGNIFSSDVIWTDSGIRNTMFDMYSYHDGYGDNISYQEDRLDFEIQESLDLEVLLSKYLTKSDIRDYKLNNLGI